MIDVEQSGHYFGDCRALLSEVPAASVQTCITSPPYWGLRDYGVEGQLGREATPDEFVANLVDVFRGVRRVLRDDGTLWLNLGDSYVTNPRGPGGAGTSTLTGTPDSDRRRQRWDASGRNGDQRFDGTRQNAIRSCGIARKNLVGVPWMVAFALRADGWILRCDVVWNKPNPMPESVTDRPTRAHEYIFLLSKSEHYFYDIDAIREPQKTLGQRHEGKSGYREGHPSKKSRTANTRKLHPLGANKRSVWTVSTKPYKGAHFATFPPDLIKPCVLAGSRPGDVVLDPFFGSGTVGMVAEQHSRRWIGFDINPAYEPLQRERVARGKLVKL